VFPESGVPPRARGGHFTTCKPPRWEPSRLVTASLGWLPVHAGQLRVSMPGLGQYADDVEVCALARQEHPEEVPAGPDGDGLVGRRVRELRTSRGLSARAVAARAGITPAYLSRLENDRVSPTISTLTRVLQAIGVPVSQLFTADAGTEMVVRAGERRRIDSEGVTDYLLTPQSAQRLRILETVIAAEADSGGEAYTHPGDEECVVVLAGALRIWIDEKPHDLAEGDSITFACRRAHRWANPGAAPARALWVITPAESY
jgi:transcriptional regulator with XRE-family HTH domain